MNVENNADYEKQACLAELQRMSPEELLVLAKLIAGDRVLPETCVHEASHAVVASLLNVPFEYVTVPQVALPLFNIERTSEEAREEFSGDDLILDRFLLRFKPELTRSYLLGRVGKS